MHARRSYAQVLQGFIRDCARLTREKGPGGTPLALDPTEPLYIVELGAGSGKFSFFMLITPEGLGMSFAAAPDQFFVLGHCPFVMSEITGMQVRPLFQYHH